MRTHGAGRDGEGVVGGAQGDGGEEGAVPELGGEDEGEDLEDAAPVGIYLASGGYAGEGQLVVLFC